MQEGAGQFNKTAISLSRNPLGIIALYIVLVYAFASLITAFSSSFQPSERQVLVYFLVLFPLIVLGVFSWLVSCHSEKLFAPSDFSNEDNYVKTRMSIVASLAAATARTSANTSTQELDFIISSVQKTIIRDPKPSSAVKKILWVDDRPENNVYERRAFESLGIVIRLALSTEEAFARFSSETFVAVISDMGRREGPREGYVLLDRMRQQGFQSPLFFYASSCEPEHVRETLEHGGQGCTNNAQALFEMVTGAIMP